MQFRELRDWQLAELGGVAPSHLSLYLSGQRSPTLRQLDKLAAGWGCSPEEAMKFIRERIATKAEAAKAS